MQISKIYLSASQQMHNTVIGGQFTEQEEMHIYVRDHLLPKLQAKGFDVRASTTKNDMYGNINEANAFMGNSGLYIAHHTNATGLPGGTHDGTLVLDYGSPRSKILAQCLYEAIAPVTPSSDEGVRSNPGLAELKRPLSPAALIEIWYHDNLNDVKWGLTHMDQTADAEVRAIEKAVKLLSTP